MKYTSLQAISRSDGDSSSRCGMYDRTKRLKKSFVIAQGREELFRKRHQFKQWIKIMQWALICYLPEQELSRCKASLYFKRARIEKTRIMNAMVLEATPIHMSSQVKSEIYEQSVVFEDHKTGSLLNHSQDMYLDTLLDEKCLTYPSQEQKLKPPLDNL